MPDARSPKARPRASSPTRTSYAPIWGTRMLEVSALSVAYGKHEALSGVALTVERREIVAILGANGAGKSTLLKAIAGLVRPRAGASVRLAGRELLALEPFRIVEAGVALVPEGRGIFADLTVKENLALGAFARRARADE